LYHSAITPIETLDFFYLKNTQIKPIKALNSDPYQNHYNPYNLLGQRSMSNLKIQGKG